MQTYASLFEHELFALITAQIESLRDDLEGADTRAEFIRGQIYALRQMPSMMAEANKKSDQGNR